MANAIPTDMKAASVLYAEEIELYSHMDASRTRFDDSLISLRCKGRAIDMPESRGKRNKTEPNWKAEQVVPS